MSNDQIEIIPGAPQAVKADANPAQAKANETLGVTKELKPYFEALGITRNVGEDVTWQEINKAYRNKARETHPDKGGNRKAFDKVTEAKKALEAARDALANKTATDNEPKITGKVGGEKKPEAKTDYKSRLDKELEKLNKKMHDLKNKTKDSVHSPEDAYKLMSVGKDLAESLSLKYQALKVKSLIQRHQQTDLNPEQKAKLEQDTKDYLSPASKEREEKFGAMGEALGNRAHPLAGALLRSTFETGANLYSAASYIGKGVVNRIEDIKSLFSRFSNSKPEEPNVTQSSANSDTNQDEQTRGPRPGQ